jgi:hypothetical protein
LGAAVTLTNEPAIALLPIPERPSQSRAECVCGQHYTADTAAAAAWAEMHALRCPRFLTWAHERIENLSYTLGHYLPAQLLELLHQLTGIPAAASIVMPWLVGLEDRPEVDA